MASKAKSKKSPKAKSAKKSDLELMDNKLDVELNGDSTIESEKDLVNNEDTNIVEKSNDQSSNSNAESAAKVFGNIAAFNWWKKLGYFNLIWTFGIILIFLSLFWTAKGGPVWSGIMITDREIANIIFASIVLVVGISLIITTICLYYKKKIQSFDKTNELISVIFAFVPLGFIANFVLASLESKKFYSDLKVTKLGYKKPKFVMPHVFVILLAIIFIVIIASWFASWTQVPGTTSEVAPAGFLYTLVAPIAGFVNAADLIIFLMIMGGFLAIVTESGALEAGLGRMVKKLKGKEIVLVPILFILFSIGGATYGMAEETLPFYLLLIPVFLAAGFDTYTVLLTILFGAGLGTAASILNPFVVNAAVSAVGDKAPDGFGPSSGIAWRAVIYAVLVIPGCIYVTWYAWRVKKNPSKSATLDLKEMHEKEFSFDLNSLPEFTGKRKAIISIFGLTFLAMIISVINWTEVAGTSIFEDAANWIDKYFPFLGGVNKDGSSMVGAWGTWYLIEMGFLFFLSSLIVGALSWKGSKHFIDKFMFGAGDFVGVGMVIAISRGISIVVAKTGLDQIIIDNLSTMIKGIGNSFAVVFILFFVFFALSFLIPSTSGFASAVFPLVGPAIGFTGSAVSGLTVSGAIASFSLASGIVNVCMPSGGIFMSALSLSKIPLGKFYKNSWHFLVAFILLSVILLIAGQGINSIGNVDYLNPIF